jgi:hypothetical protein
MACTQGANHSTNCLAITDSTVSLRPLTVVIALNYRAASATATVVHKQQPAHRVKRWSMFISTMLLLQALFLCGALANST